MKSPVVDPLAGQPVLMPNAVPLVTLPRPGAPPPTAESVRFVWKPQTMTPVQGEKAETLMKLIATLEEDDDVQNVFGNYDVDEATLHALELIVHLFRCRFG